MKISGVKPWIVAVPVAENETQGTQGAVSPHDAAGPINVLAGAHVMLTVPNFYRLETSRADLGFYNAFIDTPLDVRDGHLHVPDKPGLGVALDLDYLRAHALEGWGA